MKNKKNSFTKLFSLLGTELWRGFALVGCIAIAFTSCGKKNEDSPGVEYMPDMYRSPSLETNMAYVNLNTGDSLEANRMPAAGTIARGYMPYVYNNDTAGYANAGRFLRNPLSNNEANLKEGEALYGKFCVHCHGASGAGDGSVGTKLPGPPPPYNGGALKNLPEGKIFHSITYGKNLMGPHASLLSQEERWKVTLYVQKLQGPATPAATAPAADSAATATAVPAK
ncbi:MAG: c-type cytochrome [Bacteroidota bacterium]